MSSRKALEVILSMSKSASPGPTPAFTTVHLSRALLIIGDEGPIGRIELSRRLGLGEGAVRTIIKHLSGENLLEPAKEGCVLNQRGMSLYKPLRSRLTAVHAVNARDLSMGKASAAVLVRGSAKLVRRGIEQRDAAIRAGGTGACTLIYRDGKLMMPMGDREDRTVEAKEPLFEELRELFAPNRDDAIMLASAPDAGTAEHCAIAAAMTLLG